MTNRYTPLLPSATSTTDDDVLAEADALLSPQRMGSRARLLLARSAQMQALHGQALQVVRSQAGALPVASAANGASVQDALAQSAAQAVVGSHHQLAAATAHAHQLAAADPLMARLQAAIDGRTPAPAAPQVVDVQATEIPSTTSSTPNSPPAP
ncbi:hypothetical protein KAK07_11850 [Ideonella sp. 4Y16]|uniref:hypothetical protein n=1 Tax=Ideonella alba TaxID=2824118 RepID=UPI001B36746B|nr:hypothetical protein [Ideonella alba]MBQ0944028.1 hypothetical protein [Ideonella alba]